MKQLNFSRKIPDLNGKDMAIGIVLSRFNYQISETILSACLKRLLELQIIIEEIQVFEVPGALEIPIVLSNLADSLQFDGLIALGAVIKGDTYHFEIVANQSAQGVHQVSLEKNIPIVNGILTTYTEQQAIERAPIKGVELADSIVELVNLIDYLEDNVSHSPHRF